MKLFDPAYLKGLGYTGTINEMNMKFFKDRTGTSRLSLNDMAFQYFGLFSNKNTLEGRYNDWRTGNNIPAPTLTQIMAMTGNFGSVSYAANKYTNIPYNQDGLGNVKSWVETGSGGVTLYTVMDVYIPTGTPPIDGWPVAVYAHPNGSTKDPNANVTSKIINPLLAAGYAIVSLEFPHPAVNKVELGGTYLDAYNDIGRAIQHIRSYAKALNLNPNRLGGVTRSRGSLMVYAALFTDRMAVSTKHWEIQSSLISSIYMVQGQTIHNSRRACEEFVFPAEHATVYATYPADETMLNAIDLVATAPQLPKLHMVNDTPFYADKVSAATILADFVHYPNMLKTMKTNMDARTPGKATTNVGVANGTEFDDLVTFFQANT